MGQDNCAGAGFSSIIMRHGRLFTVTFKESRDSGQKKGGAEMTPPGLPERVTATW